MFENEIRLFPRHAKAKTEIEVAWCFPHDYAIGMSGLGFQLIYDLLDSAPDVSVFRVFKDVAEPISRHCAYFGFTVSWELDFINVFAILEKHGIAWLSKDRGDAEPIIFGGGPVLSANPEPYADIFDIVLLGDAEETIPRLLDTARSFSGTESRVEKLERFSQCPGIYVPSLYEFSFESSKGSQSNLGAVRAIKSLHPHTPQQVNKLLFRAPEDYVAHSIILSPDTAWGDTFLIEIARSCPQECRFCLASYLTRPFRTAPVATILEKVKIARQHTSKIGLMGPSITEHPDFDGVLDGLLTIDGLSVSVASVRADTLTVELVSKLRRLGQRSVTIALESGSERLRRVMKKNLTQDEVFAAVDAIARGGMTGIKFYGIAGLPYETMDDVDETVKLITLAKKQHKQLKFVFGLTSFVPKAQTPFQWKGRDPDAKRKMEYLRKHLAKIGVEVRPESHNWSDIQALLSRGDRRLTAVLTRVAVAGESLGTWKKALKEFEDSVPGLDFYAYRDIDEQEVLPWAHIASEDKVPYLKRQMSEALMESAK